MTPEEHTVTALEYIEKQEQLEKEAQSTLPGKFEKCTFSLGYIRQPLYACKTCSVDTEQEPAGMCYSCSIACHSSHELFELFPKRNFRCDCGLPGKFNEHACALTIPAKKIIRANDKNTYNHNFQGRYCRCDQHYDPEKEEAVMYQCVACEDWFHERCIGNIPEAIEDFECYVCRDCTKKYPFLMHASDKRFSYGLSEGQESIYLWVLPSDKIKDDKKVEAETDKIKDDKEVGVDSIKSDKKVEVEDNNSKEDKEIEVEDENIENALIGEKRKLQDSQDPIIPNTFKKQKIDQSEECQNVDLTLLPPHDHIELFLQDNWRQGLCKCQKCAETYKQNNVEFLLAEEKTYEPEEDEDAGKSLLEVGMEQLQRIDRVQALESLMAYKTLADDIKTYLESFKDTGKTVTKEDIEAFFAKKRQEREEH
ncbi:uncharacterized protein B0P05DRAFT_525289 [Gilbertella persicaria]|uniref:uncharacterized protein n=1 Tax=Gilbertella persicaria TaxID=101096 RepID=UPI002220466D|nr:uncharacterized protein B0P05DRAFT_525289 [Gilbertella persicaria]KAI8092213.1 hypothetical protein B0P05DRAFT_525289 [Gilbertella persicaria]